MGAKNARAQASTSLVYVCAPCHSRACIVFYDFKEMRVKGPSEESLTEIFAFLDLQGEIPRG